MSNTHYNLIEAENSIQVKARTCISLLDFFRTGNFGPVQLGMSRQEVYDLLGEPDDYGCPNTSLMEANVWLYDAIELHFFDEFPLWLICTDHISYPDWWVSERIKLDAWLFSNGYQPNKRELEAGLAEQNIPYTYIEMKPKDEEDVKGKFIFESRVEILIADEYRWFKTLRRKAKLVRQSDMAMVIQIKRP